MVPYAWRFTMTPQLLYWPGPHATHYPTHWAPPFGPCHVANPSYPHSSSAIIPSHVCHPTPDPPHTPATLPPRSPPHTVVPRPQPHPYTLPLCLGHTPVPVGHWIHWREGVAGCTLTGASRAFEHCWACRTAPPPPPPHPMPVLVPDSYLFNAAWRPVLTVHSATRWAGGVVALAGLH